MFGSNSLKCICVFMLLGYCVVLDQGYANDLPASFWDEPQKKWTEYLDKVGKYGCSMQDRIQWPSETQKHSIEAIGKYPYFISTVKNADHQELVLGYNKKYSFSLRRDIGEGSNWIVNRIEQLPPPNTELSFSATDFSSRNSVGKNIRDVMCAGLRIRIYWLPDLIRKPEFRILSSVISEENDLRIATIQFSLESKVPMKDCDVKNGTIVLLPDYYWLILRGKCQFSDGDPQNDETGTILNHYDFSSDKIPLLIRNEEHGVDPNGKFLLDVLRDYSGFSNTATVPHSRFTLSHYGLPEPDFGESRANRIRYIIMASGVLLIVIGLWRMYKKRQEHTT